MSNKTRYDGTRAAVARFIEDNHLLVKGDKVIVALSGGADSVTLLHLLISFKEEYDLGIYAAHFHHGIRGAEADRDEAFVTELCGRYEIPLCHEKADVPAIAAQTNESLELCGRRLRYRFLEKLADKIGGAKIATAHHLGDNAETVLWNLTRGSGIGGLCGIPVQRGCIIRPLLCCTRSEIEAYCRDNALEYVTDSTNLSDDCTRNKLRHQVMPALRELNPGAEESIAQTTFIMREADSYLNKISLEELNNAKSTYGYACSKLLRLEPIILQFAVKNVMENAGAPVDFRHIALIIEAMRTHGAVSLTGDCTAVCTQGTLRIVKDDAVRSADDAVLFSEYIKTHGRRVTVRDGVPVLTSADIAEDRLKINKLLLKNGIPCDIITPDTVIRTRRAGDVFTDADRGVTKTLKKLMNELKIPRELRDTIPVVANGSTVLWMSGCGTSAQAKADLTRNGDIILLTD